MSFTTRENIKRVSLFPGYQYVLFLGILSISFIVGCSNGDKLKRVSVSGKVSVDGVTVETGNITFTPKPGTECPLIGAEIKNGRYTFTNVNGPVPGEYLVTLYSQKATGKKIKVPAGSTPSGVTEVDEFVSIIPKKYDPVKGKEKLTATVVQGDNEINFELDSK
ncbi:MAG: hypothetical protein Q4F84_10125 [Fibrobacter sp.]|nr:hypothetical protein [Fibrobacter sp.]